MRFETEAGQSGLWFVTSPDVPGLFVSGHSRDDAERKARAVAAELASLDADDMLARVTSYPTR